MFDFLWVYLLKPILMVAVFLGVILYLWFLIAPDSLIRFAIKQDIKYIKRQIKKEKDKAEVERRKRKARELLGMDPDE